MKIISNNKGITIIMLIITIIVLLLLTSLAIFYSNNIAPESQIAVAYSNLREIKRACEEAKFSIEINPDVHNKYDYFGKTIYEQKDKNGDPLDIADIKQRCGLNPADPTDGFSNTDGDVYLIAPLTEDNEDGDISRRLKALGLSRITNSYIVDLDHDDYYVLGGVKRKSYEYLSGDNINNTTLYEYREIQKLYEMLTKSETE